MIDIYVNFENKYFLSKILCKNNNLKVLKYLVNTFNITENFTKSENNFTFRYAAGNGHLEVLKYLMSTFNINEN